MGRDLELTTPQPRGATAPRIQPFLTVPTASGPVQHSMPTHLISGTDCSPPGPCGRPPSFPVCQRTSLQLQTSRWPRVTGCQGLDDCMPQSHTLPPWLCPTESPSLTPGPLTALFPCAWSMSQRGPRELLPPPLLPPSSFFNPTLLPSSSPLHPDRSSAGRCFLLCPPLELTAN